MSKRSNKINVYLEIGQKRTFAGAVDWPGWCRSGRDEESALQALFDYSTRYAKVVRAPKLGFQVPPDASALVVVERLKGNATTDFGAPGIVPSADSRPVSDEEFPSYEKLLRACWRAFDGAVKTAEGTPLHTGPRGGGRQVEGMIQHLLESDAGYLSSVGWKLQRSAADDLEQAIEQTRQAILSALGASARGEISPKGPRGGLRWTARYFVRRVAWHVLDHAWEIEDRASPITL